MPTLITDQLALCFTSTVLTRESRIAELLTSILKMVLHAMAQERVCQAMRCWVKSLDLTRLSD